MSDTISPEVFELLGRAVLQSQHLERTFVVQHLLLGNTLDPQAVTALEVELKKKPLGRLLKTWKKFIPENKSLFSFLHDVVEERNLLTHRLFHDPRFKTNENYKKVILNTTARLRSAQMLVYGNNPRVREELDEHWGINPEDSAP